MSEYIKISDAEYEKLLEEARSRLETMSPEQISELRAICNDVLSKIIHETEKDVSNYTKLVEQWKKPLDLDYVNPVRQAKKRFWLGQLVNFVAVAIFKLPREFTPVYEYSHESAKKYDDQAKAYDTKLNRMFNDAKNITEVSVKGFSEILSKIVYDDAALIAFCDSLENLSFVEQIVKASDSFKKIASLFYLNNISFNIETFRTTTKESVLTGRVDAFIEEIKKDYKKAKSNGVNKHM